MGANNNKSKKKDEIKKINKEEQQKFDFKEYYEENFFRNFKKDFFFEFAKNNEENYNLNKIWKIKLDEDRLSNKNKNINKKVLEINNEIYNNYENILKKYNYNTENKEEFGKNIELIFCILCNIYDLVPNCVEMYFQEKWIEMHLKLFDICLNFKDLPKLYILVDNSNKIYSLEYFLTLFCICMSKDENYFYRKLILKKYPEFFYKVLLIAIYITNVCCCGHGLNYENNQSCSCFKAGDIIFDTFENIEDKDLLLTIKEIKLKCLEFMINNLGKNISSIYLLRMTELSKNKYDIFNYIINESNLLKETLKRDSDDFGHCMEHFEVFISMCKSPDLLFKILVFISPPKIGLKRRIYTEILKTLNNIINEKDVENLENSLYNSVIFQKILETLNYDVWLGEYEGIWGQLLNSENQYIIDIFHKNKYDVSNIFLKQVENLIKNELIEMRMTAVIRIMLLFIKIGEKVKIKFGGENFYVNEFKDIYLKISQLSSLKEDEDYIEFKNYYI